VTGPADDQAGPTPPVPAAPSGRAWIACALAWVLPGLGHLYLGRRRRAAVFFVVVLAMFFLDLASGGAATLADPRQPLTYLATADNIATGPIEVIGRRRTYGRLVYRLPPDEADPERVELLGRLRRKVSGGGSEYGSTFLLTAGLMNILLILDAWDIATRRKS
jgi:TM2 domain-containing membrane protein YozV